MATVTIEYFGMTGSGRTVTEAKRDAGAKIERALSGSWTPEIVEWRGCAILIHREPQGWCRTVIAGPEGVRGGRCWGAPNEDTFESAKLCAQIHLADMASTLDDTEPPEFLRDRNLIREWHLRQEFQRRYVRARAAGLADNECHHYACSGSHHPEWSRIVATVEAA